MSTIFFGRSTTASCWGEGEAVGAGTFVTAVALLLVSGDPQPARKRAKTGTVQRKPRRFRKLISPPIVDSGCRRFILQGQKKGARSQKLAGTHQPISLNPKPLVILPE